MENKQLMYQGKKGVYLVAEDIQKDFNFICNKNY